MNWYVELKYEDGSQEAMYCTTREEARERRRFYLRNSRASEEGKTWIIGKILKSATVRKV